MSDFGERLSRLEEQREDGQITDDEYRELRAHLLARRDRRSLRLVVVGTVAVVLVVVAVILAVA